MCGRTGRTFKHGKHQHRIGDYVCDSSMCHMTQAPPTSQSEQNMNRNAILGPAHLTVRELRQQWEWKTWPQASWEREGEGKGRRGKEREGEGKEREGKGPVSHNHSLLSCTLPNTVHIVHA